jgi:7-keto-8-aminopelargonate synthetase-like enzyme
MSGEQGADRATAWADRHGAELIGTPFTQAERAITDAGLHVRAVRPPTVPTLEFRTDRITLVLDEADIVTSAHGG